MSRKIEILHFVQNDILVRFFHDDTTSQGGETFEFPLIDLSEFTIKESDFGGKDERIDFSHRFREHQKA